MQGFYVNDSGRLMVQKDMLLSMAVYTDNSYRKTKSIGGLREVKRNDGRWVFVDSLSTVSREKVLNKFSELTGEYKKVLNEVSLAGDDPAQIAVEFTAESLHINEPFIRSSIETYIISNYVAFTGIYLEFGLNSKSVKGYAKQCALVQWIYDFAKKIKSGEPDAKRCEILMRSYRMNLLTALAKIELEVKIPLSETRFNAWFDGVLKQMDAGSRPQDIITVKRKSNNNAGKITPEQLNVAAYWHINGTNMSIAAVYKKWIEFAKQKGWWTDEKGNFNPPSEARLYQLLSPLKNANTLEKTDAVTYRANNVPTVSRDLPEKKNHVWVIDGTAHNENVEGKGKVRQHIYAIKIADVATLKMVGACPVMGVKEPFWAVKEAILMGIMETGYKPAIIQCDRGPAWKELEAWCEENDVKLYPAIAGNARSKTIENMFFQFDNDITRFLKGYSGQNRTALSINSRSSDKRETKGKQNARSMSISMDWIRNEGMKLWNERIIETLERKKCNKSPNQLWEEKESYVPLLSYEQVAVLCGACHERKLTINGLDIEHKTVPYTYFPPFSTSEERAEATKIFTDIPLKSDSANRLKIYIIKGGAPAPVYTGNGKFLGIWKVKTNAAYIAETAEDKATLNNYMALQCDVQKKAKEINAGIKQGIESHPDFEAIDALGHEPLTGKRVISRYDKSALLEEEIEAKDGTGTKENASIDTVINETPQYREIVDPDTGEIHTIKINHMA